MSHPSIIGDFDGPTIHVQRPETYQIRPPAPQVKCSRRRELIAALPKDAPGEWDDADRRSEGEQITDAYLSSPSLETATRLREWVRG
jgi:hypothetical protein